MSLVIRISQGQISAIMVKPNEEPIEIDHHRRIIKDGPNQVMYGPDGRIEKYGGLAIGYDALGRVERVGNNWVHYSPLTRFISHIGSIAVRYHLFSLNREATVEVPS